MAAYIMGHGDAGYCEHCPGDAGTEESVKRPSLDDNRGVCGVCGADVFGECICGDVLPIAEEMGGSREELRVLDASLSLDAVACAEGAVHEFAESIETDVRYALGQLRGVRGAGSEYRGADRVSRALDALERVEGRITAATCEDAGV